MNHPKDPFLGPGEDHAACNTPEDGPATSLPPLNLPAFSSDERRPQMNETNARAYIWNAAQDINECVKHIKLTTQHKPGVKNSKDELDDQLSWVIDHLDCPVGPLAQATSKPPPGLEHYRNRGLYQFEYLYYATCGKIRQLYDELDLRFKNRFMSNDTAVSVTSRVDNHWQDIRTAGDLVKFLRRTWHVLMKSELIAALQAAIKINQYLRNLESHAGPSMVAGKIQGPTDSMMMVEYRKGEEGCLRELLSCKGLLQINKMSPAMIAGEIRAHIMREGDKERHRAAEAQQQQHPDLMAMQQLAAAQQAGNSPRHEVNLYTTAAKRYSPKKRYSPTDGSIKTMPNSGLRSTPRLSPCKSEAREYMCICTNCRCKIEHCNKPEYRARPCPCQLDNAYAGPVQFQHPSSSRPLATGSYQQSPTTPTKVYGVYGRGIHSDSNYGVRPHIVTPTRQPIDSGVGGFTPRKFFLTPRPPRNDSLVPHPQYTSPKRTQEREPLQPDCPIPGLGHGHHKPLPPVPSSSTLPRSQTEPLMGQTVPPSIPSGPLTHHVRSTSQDFHAQPFISAGGPGKINERPAVAWHLQAPEPRTTFSMSVNKLEAALPRPMSRASPGQEHAFLNTSRGRGKSLSTVEGDDNGPYDISPSKSHQYESNPYTAFAMAPDYVATGSPEPRKKKLFAVNLKKVVQNLGSSSSKKDNQYQ